MPSRRAVANVSPTGIARAPLSVTAGLCWTQVPAHTPPLTRNQLPPWLGMVARWVVGAADAWESVYGLVDVTTPVGLNNFPTCVPASKVRVRGGLYISPAQLLIWAATSFRIWGIIA